MEFSLGAEQCWPAGWDGTGKWSCLSFLLYDYSNYLFHCVNDVSQVDFRALPEPLMFVDGYLIVDLYWEGWRVGSPASLSL